MTLIGLYIEMLHNLILKKILKNSLFNYFDQKNSFFMYELLHFHELYNHMPFIL